MHTYHGSYPTTPLGSVPPGFIAEHLNLTPADGLELQRAYRADHTHIQKVELAYIYAVTTGDGAEAVPPLEKERATAWRGTSYWAITPPGLSHPLLYTVASAQVLAWGEDNGQPNLTKTLVLVVPKDASVRVTNLQHVTTDEELTLRDDLLLMAHDVPDHPGKERTMSYLKQLAYWPGMVEDTAYHVKTCKHCIPKLATRQAMFRPVKTTGAVDAAIAFLCGWSPQYGLPEVIRSDNGSAFGSAVFNALRNLIGLKEWDASADDDPTHHSMLESKHAHLQDVLDQATEKGELQCPIKLALYVAKAEAHENQLLLQNGTTAMERTTGSKPRTIIDAAKLRGPFPAHLIPADIDGGTANREFVSTLYDVMLQTTAWDLEQRDAKVRSDVQRRQVKHAAKKTDKEDLRPGDDVGLKGKRVRIVEHTLQGPTGPSKTKVHDPHTDPDALSTRVVKSTDLRRLADRRAEHTYHVPTEVIPPGAFVLYMFGSDDSNVGAGIVTNASSQDTVQVHVCRQADKQKKRFTPYYHDLNSTQWVQNRAAPPVSQATARMVTIPRDKILLHAEIYRGMVTQAVLDRAAALGVDLEDKVAREDAVALPSMRYTIPAIPEDTSAIMIALTAMHNNKRSSSEWRLKQVRQNLNTHGYNPFGSRDTVLRRYDEIRRENRAVTVLGDPPPPGGYTSDAASAPWQAHTTAAASRRPLGYGDSRTRKCHPVTDENEVTQTCNDIQTLQLQPKAAAATEQRYTIVHTVANVALVSIKWIPTVAFYCMLILFYVYFSGTVKVHLELN